MEAGSWRWYVFQLTHCITEGSEIVMGKFLQEMCGMDITCIQVYFISDVILWSQYSALVVVLSHVFFGLCECRPGL